MQAKMNSKEDSSVIKSSGFIKMYLTVYDLIQTVCWLTILQRLLFHDYKALSGKTTSTSLFQNVKYPVTIAHLLMLLEVIHATTNITASNIKTTVIQIFLRMYVSCVINRTAGNSIGYSLVVHAWTFADLARYSYYTLNSMGCVPYIMKWLRYSIFFVTIPVGAIGEHICLFAAHVHVMMKGSWMTRIFNFYYVTLLDQYTLYALWVISTPLFLQLYMHLLRQRREVLGQETISTTTNTKKPQ